jgi:hypothetical protein
MASTSQLMLFLLVGSYAEAFIKSASYAEAFLPSIHPTRVNAWITPSALSAYGEEEQQQHQPQQYSPSLLDDDELKYSSRRTFLKHSTIVVSGCMSAEGMFIPQHHHVAQAIGPTKITLEPTSYSAIICPPNKPIPGQKAMVGMRGLCVTVYANLKETPSKELEKVGVYGFVTDGDTGDSVLANNPDLSTDSGQFAMIEKVKPNDQSIVFEFIAAVPMDRDISQYENGIGPLNFDSLRIISYPGGQQFGEISPCEMNEFSTECEEWEQINGPYVKQEYMIKSNPRTKGQ